MYVSEYYYAASPTYWSYLGYGSATTDYRAATSSNWMYMGVYEWTITRRADLSYRSFSVNAAGYMSNYTVYDNYAVRPSFNLESTVKYVSGTGAKNSPFRISS